MRALLVCLTLLAIPFAQAQDTPKYYRSEWIKGQGPGWIATYQHLVFTDRSPVYQMANRISERFRKQHLDPYLKRVRATPPKSTDYSTPDLSGIQSVILTFPEVVSFFLEADISDVSDFEEGHNIAMVKGKPQEILLEQLFKNPERGVKALVSRSIPKLKERGASFLPKGLYQPGVRVYPRLWFINTNGITMLYGPYHPGTSYWVSVDYKDLADVIDPEGPLKPVLAGEFSGWKPASDR